MKVIFVDDDPQVLRGLERMLDAAEVEWDLKFVSSAADALDAMQEERFDAIVSDMRMPGMDGARLLEVVSKQHPDAIRIVLSGQADKETVLRAISPMHQYLAKPCDAESLKNTLSQACALREVLNSTELRELVAGISSLPCVPSVYTELMEQLESEDPTIAAIGEIISQDPAMSAKILQLTNSAAFGVSRKVLTPGEAASFLGTENIKALALSVGVFQKYEGGDLDGFSIDNLLKHSLEVAQFGSKIARAEKMKTSLVNEVFTIGVLHDIGKLVLATSEPQRYQQALTSAQEQNQHIAEAEIDVFGTCHASMGAYLLNLWGLPQSIVEIVGLHHRHQQVADARFTPLTVVCIANRLSRTGGDMDDESLEFLERIGYTNRLTVWRDVCFVEKVSA